MTKATQAAAVAAALFSLGPQDDGTIIVQLPDEYHRVIAQKAIEKQLKNAGAAEGTVSALADGADPFLARVRNGLEKLNQILVGARPASNQLDNTPMGEALRAASSDTSGGLTWDVDVPSPRPKIGELVRWPTGQSESITGIEGYSSESKAFVASSDDSKFPAIVPGPVAGEWRLLSLLLEYADDAATERAAAREGTANSDGNAGAAMPGETAATTTTAAPAKPVSTQRARNMAQSGVKKSASATRPAPKPSAKGGKKR